MRDILLDNLTDQLFSDIYKGINNSGNLFKTKRVIVPSTKVASYLRTYYLKNYDTVLMNIEILSKEKGFFRLFETDKKLCSSSQMRNIIIKHLNNNSTSISELYEYLSGDVRDLKLFDISNELTNLFIDYESDDIQLEAYQKNIYDEILKELDSIGLTTLKSLLNNNSFASTDTIYVFGFSNYTNLESNIISKYKSIKQYDIDTAKTRGEKLYIKKAPSKLREIENLHSEICNILRDKITNKESISFSDFLVVGTNMSEYEDNINRVFNQDDINYPNIPFYINAPRMKNNHVYNALVLFKEIINKGFYTRLDFSDLINNNAIRKAIGISDEDIFNFENSINDTNTFRGNDFDYIKKRLLLSKICDINNDDYIINIGGKEYIPYSRVGLNDDAIAKFIKLINDLNGLIKAFNVPTVTLNNIDNMKQSLDNFLSIMDNNQTETNGYYKRIYDVFDFFKSAKLYDIPTKTFMEVLIDSSTKSITNKGELYASGISFTEFEPNIVLSAKYIFFINSSSANLPIKKTRNALNKNEVIKYDDEHNTFNSYYNNATQKFYVSYVYRNLKSDEEFYLSNFVKELNDPYIDIIKKRDPEKKNEFKDNEIDKIGIDEDRNIEDIYTQRGKRNKEFKSSLLNANATPSMLINGIPIIPSEITTTQLGKFLNEPLESKASRLFGSKDDIDKDLEQEYEPFELGNIEKANIFTKLAVTLLADQSKVGEIRKSIELRNDLPSVTNVIEDKVFNDLVDEVNKLRDYINGYSTSFEVSPSIKKYAINDSYIINNAQFIRIVLENKRIYIPIKKIDGFKTKDALVMYVIALMDIISLDDDTYKIVICPDIKNNYFSSMINNNELCITKAEAEGKLKEIYISFINYNENVFFDFSLFSEKESDKCKKSLYDLIDKIYSQNGFWEFFDDKKLFDKHEELGYSDNTYYNRDSSTNPPTEKSELVDMQKKQKNLLGKIAR